MVQVSKKFKTLDKEKLLEEQNKQRKKYGLKPLKRLQADWVAIKNLYQQDDTEPIEESPEQESDDWRAYQ